MDEVAVQQFFMKEIAVGEQLLGLGDIENGIEHLANAVAVTAHKENLLNMLRTSLPDPVFRLLVERLPAVSQVIIRYFIIIFVNILYFDHLNVSKVLKIS